MGDAVADRSDRELLGLSFSETFTQKKLDNFLRRFDIESEKTEKILMLAYFKKLHPSAVFPEYAGPRLDGILNYYKFANIKTLSGFSEIGKALNAAGIPILLFKGGAMKFLRPDLHRPMGDVDFLVPPERYEEAVAIAGKIGFKPKFEKPSPHSTDCVEEKGRAVDIHCMTLKGKEAKHSKVLDEEIFGRAKKKQAFGVDFFIPCDEDFLFLILLNLFNNIRHSESVEGRLFSIFDCKFFLERNKEFNWNAVLSNAEKTETSYQIKLMVKFINSLTSNVFPRSLNLKMPATDKMKRDIEGFVFEWFALKSLRKYKKTMHWKTVKDGGLKKILVYLHAKLKLKILEALGKIPPAVSLFSNYYQKKAGKNG
jgi:hypothetical protein